MVIYDNATYWEHIGNRPGDLALSATPLALRLQRTGKARIYRLEKRRVLAHESQIVSPVADIHLGSNPIELVPEHLVNRLCVAVIVVKHESCPSNHDQETARLRLVAIFERVPGQYISQVLRRRVKYIPFVITRTIFAVPLIKQLLNAGHQLAVRHA